MKRKIVFIVLALLAAVPVINFTKGFVWGVKFGYKNGRRPTRDEIRAHLA